MANKIFEQVDNYISDLLGKEDVVLQDVISRLREKQIPNASISSNQGKFLQVLALTARAKRILEIGTLAGYSTIWLARILPEGGHLISIEYDLTHATLAREHIQLAGLEDKVDIIHGAALDILPQLKATQQEPFDMIFIDADKQPYVEYFKWAIQLGRPGTIIVADNVIRNGNVLDNSSADEKVIGVQQLNAYLSTCTNVTATIVQNVGIKEHDGMVIAVVNTPELN